MGFDIYYDYLDNRDVFIVDGEVVIRQHINERQSSSNIYILALVPRDTHGAIPHRGRFRASTTSGLISSIPTTQKALYWEAWAKGTIRRKHLLDLMQRDISEGVTVDDFPSEIFPGLSLEAKNEWIKRWQHFKIFGEDSFFKTYYRQYRNLWQGPFWNSHYLSN